MTGITLLNERKNNNYNFNISNSQLPIDWPLNSSLLARFSWARETQETRETTARGANRWNLFAPSHRALGHLKTETAVIRVKLPKKILIF